MPIQFNAIVADSITKAILIDAPVSFVLNMKNGNNLRFFPKMLGTVGFSTLGYIIRDSLNYFIDDSTKLKPMISGSIGGAIKYTLINSHAQRQSILEIALTASATSILSAHSTSSDDELENQENSQKQNNINLDDINSDQNSDQSAKKSESNDFSFQQQRDAKPDDARPDEILNNFKAHSDADSERSYSIDSEGPDSVNSLPPQKDNAARLNYAGVEDNMASSAGSGEVGNAKHSENEEITEEAHESANIEHDENPEILLRSPSDFSIQEQSIFKLAIVGAVNNAMYESLNYYQICNKNQMLSEQSCRTGSIIVIEVVEGVLRLALNVPSVYNSKTKMDTISTALLAGVATASASYLYKIYSPSVKNKISYTNSALVDFYNDYGPNVTMSDIYDTSYNISIINTTVNLGMKSTVTYTHGILADIYGASFDLNVRNTTFHLGINNTVVYAKDTFAYLYDNYSPNMTDIIYRTSNEVVDLFSSILGSQDNSTTDL